MKNHQDKKIYFLSDIHLGAPYIKDHKEHEQRVVRFLDDIKKDAEEIFFLGDIFDFWLACRYTIPQGFTRFLGKVAELSDAGIKIHFFGGNHDMWMFDYFQKELGIEVHLQSKIIERYGKRYFLAHGEDLGIDDKAFKMLLSVFRASWFHWVIRTLVHPDWMMFIARKWSGKSRHKNDEKQVSNYLGENKEYLVKFAKSYRGEDINYFIFGHRHIVLDLMIKKDSRVIILGDWIRHFTYAVVDQSQLQLNTYFES